MSGFYTAMLWCKRGLLSLVKHRAKRILPLVYESVVRYPFIGTILIGKRVRIRELPINRIVPTPTFRKREGEQA
jgi:hypothetical protein